jgi:hypothetical protein
MHGSYEKGILVRKLEGKRLLGRSRHRIILEWVLEK